MTAPNYTTDLTTINTAEATTGYTEPTGATAGGIAVAEVDYFIQGTGCISKTFNATGLGGLHYNNGSGITIPTDGAYIAWIYYSAPNALATEANGGMRLSIGSGGGDYKSWYVRGNDTYAYGGWICIPVDPTVTADVTTGTPTTTYQYFGYIVNSINAVAKGNPFGFDVIRYGRCEARINGGDLANGYATFAGYATQNDSTTNRWGLIQAVSGGYQVQGLVVLGYTSAVDFRDNNTSIVIADTKKVSSNFNAFEVRQATSRLDWSNITFLALGTVSRGNFITTDNADINITNCTFTNMGTFGFQSNSTILTSTFRNCNLITQNSANFTGCTFDSTNDSVKALLSNNLTNISNCSFISGGTKHAIELTNACAGNSYSFAGNTFTGYAATDGSTGNECIYNNSGGAVTINISEGDTPSIRNGSGASTVVNSSVDVTIHIEDTNQVAIENARVYVTKNSDSSVIINGLLTNSSGNVVGSTVSGAGGITIRVRKSSDGATKYVPTQATGTVGGSNLTINVTMSEDSIADVTTNTTIAGDFTINTTTKTIRHTADAVVYTAKDLYTWLMNYFDDSALMDDSIPMTAQTPTEFTLVNGWFMNDTSMQFINGGAIQTSGWTHPTNTTGIRILTLATISGVDDTDLGTTVAGVTTGDTGKLVDYNTTLKKLWVRTDATDDDFNNTSENINVNGSLAGAMGGSTAVTGETIWSNIFTLGTLVSGTTLDVYQNDAQIAPFWSSGHIDVLIKVKEASVETDSGNLTILARKFSTLYDHTVIDASTGRNPVPLAAFNDTNNQTAEGTVSGYSDITITFGYYSYDLNNGNGARPYDVQINCAGRILTQVYEYLKYVTRTGSSTTLNGVSGEYYTAVGDIRLNYTGETNGPFVQGSTITSNSGGTGYIVSLIDNGTTGTLVIRNTHGTFSDTNTLTSGSTTATINGTPDTITQSKQAPFGTFAGGKLFGARGVKIYNMHSNDANNYVLTDSTNTTQTPPSTVALVVDSVESGDRIGVYRATGDNTIVDKEMFTCAANNNSGETTFDITTTIPSDTPSTGTLRVVDTSDATSSRETSYTYTGWSGSTFSGLSPTLDRNYTATDDKAYVPYIEEQATTTSVTKSITYASDRYVVVVVRKKGILPFIQKKQITSSGMSVSAIRTTDSIVT